MSNTQRAKNYIKKNIDGEFRSSAIFNALDIIPRNNGHVFKQLKKEGFLKVVRTDSEIVSKGKINKFDVYIMCEQKRQFPFSNFRAPWYKFCFNLGSISQEGTQP